MLVFNGGPSLAASTDYVFTCVSGNIKYVGNVGYRGCNLYYYEGSSYPGLFCSDGNNGVIRTTYYEMRNGSIASQDLGESETNLGGAQRFLPFYTLDEIRAMGWNEFVKATEEIPAGRCYLDLSGTNLPARGVLGIGNDGSTAIEGIDVEATEDETWYDLQGRRIQKPTKAGIYIVNGKKVIINNK